MTYEELKAEALVLGDKTGWMAVPCVGKEPIRRYSHLLGKRWSFDDFMELWPDDGRADGFGVIWPDDVVAVEADGPDGEAWIHNHFKPTDLETVCFSSTRGPHYLYRGRTDGLDPKPHEQVEVLGRPSKTLMFVPPMAGKTWLGGHGPGERDLRLLPEYLPRSRPKPNPDRGNALGFNPERGERHVELTRVAGHLRNAGLDGEQVFTVLDALNQSEGLGLPGLEVANIAKSSNQWTQKEDDQPTEPGEMRRWLEWWSEDEPFEWLFYPMIPSEAFVLMFGPTQSSKSMLALWLSKQIADNGMKVTYYSEENSRRSDRSRMRRLGMNQENFRLANNWAVNLADPAEVEGIIERDRGRDLIVLDTYSQTYHPNWTMDENQKAIDHSRTIRHIIAKTGASIVSVDHTGYENATEPRGASAKRQQAEVALCLTGNEWTGGDAYFRVVNQKAARYGNPFNLEGYVVDTPSGGLNVMWRGLLGKQKAPTDILNWGAHGVISE